MGGEAADLSVLVLEDDAILRSVWADALTEEGCQVVEAAAPDEAIALIRRDRFDVLLLDLMLGCETSVDVSAYAQVFSPDTFTVLITGSGLFSRGDHREGAPGVDWILRKPVALDDLAAVVAHAGRIRRATAGA